MKSIVLVWAILGCLTPAVYAQVVNPPSNVNLASPGPIGNTTPSTASFTSVLVSGAQSSYGGIKLGGFPSASTPIFADNSQTDRYAFRLTGTSEWDGTYGTPVFSVGKWHSSTTADAQLVKALNFGFAQTTYTGQGILRFNSGGGAVATDIGVTNTGVAAGSDCHTGNCHNVGFTPSGGFYYWNGSAVVTLQAAASFTNGNYYVVTFVVINGVATASVTPLGSTSGGFTFALTGTWPTAANFVAESQSVADVQFGLRYAAGATVFVGNTSSQIDIPTSDSAYNFAWPMMLTVPGNPSGTNKTYIVVPPNYRPSGQYPWVIYVTGHGQPGCSILGCASGGTWTNQGALVSALAYAGYVVVAMDYTSLTNWGNADSNLDTAALAAQWPQWFNLSSRPYVIMESMGGIVTLNSIFNGKLNPRAIVGLYPVYSLSSMYAAGSGTFASEIQTAYSFGSPSGYAAATAGYDPALDPAASFAGIPVDIWCSAGDTIVNCSTNGQSLVTAINAAGGFGTFNASSGNHGDVSNFNASAVINFFNSH